MHHSAKSIFIVAGEESGDQYAAQLVQQLTEKYPDLQFSGVGGNHMAQAGVHLLSDLARYGVTGLIEVVRYARIIRQTFKNIQAFLAEYPPTLLILIDYPGFNLRLAKFAKKHLGITILYYISPQIWAWKPKRIQTIKAYVDQMAVILPFEKEYYRKAGVDVAFVGHPLVQRIALAESKPLNLALTQLPKHKTIIGLLPGSRTHEVERHMPVYLSAAKQLIKQSPSHFHFVIPVAETLDVAFVQSWWSSEIPCTFIKGQAIDVARVSQVVIVASGTASLECALLSTPMCIVYKASYLTYLVASKLIQVKYLGLCNLMMNQMIVPELLQYDFNEKELTLMILNLLNDEQVIQKMKSKLHELKHSLSSETADCTLMELVEKMIF